MSDLAKALVAKVAAPVDIMAFDAVAECADGHEFELLHQDGETGTGIIIVVQGKHSDEVFKWMSATVQKTTMEIEMAHKQRKQPKAKTMEELRAQNIEGAAVRCVGWKNVTQQFNRELMKAALLRNPHWIDQIVTQSDDLGNFTPKSSESCTSTPGTNSD